MVFDNKKEHKEFYLPPKTPGIVNAPAMSFLAARGHGEPCLLYTSDAADE